MEAVMAIAKAKTLTNLFSNTFTEERLEVKPSNINKPILGKYLDSFEITPQMVLEKIQMANHQDQMVGTQFYVPY